MKSSIPLFSLRYARIERKLRRNFVTAPQRISAPNNPARISISRGPNWQRAMSSQYKPSITWGHNSTQTEEKRNEVFRPNHFISKQGELILSKVINLAKAVADFEHKQSGSGFYIVIAPKEGENTRLEIILKYDALLHHGRSMLLLS